MCAYAEYMARLYSLDALQQFTAVKLQSDPGIDPADRKIPSCAEINIAWNLPDGKQAHNVLHGRYSGAYAATQAQANSIMTGLTTGAQWTALAGFLHTTALLASVSIRDRAVDNAPYITSSNSAVPGTSAGTIMPDELAIVATLRTAFTGPQHRGRIYLCGFATNAVGSGGTVAATCVTAVTNWAGIIAGVLNAQGYLFSIAHMHRVAYTGSTGTIHDERPAGTVPVLTAVCRDNHWDSQRRRGLK